MAPPKGSKYALGLHFGRPKIYTKEEIEQQAQQLLEWAESDSALILREFAAIQGYSRQRLKDFCDNSDIFSDAYSRAKNIIGCRREMLALDKMIPRYGTYYDEELQEHENEHEKFKAQLKNMTPEQKEELAYELREFLTSATGSDSEIPRPKEPLQSKMETEQSLLHKNPKGRKGKVQFKLGTKGTL
jgi:hypothetical protein